MANLLSDNYDAEKRQMKVWVKNLNAIKAREARQRSKQTQNNKKSVKVEVAPTPSDEDYSTDEGGDQCDAESDEENAKPDAPTIGSLLMIIAVYCAIGN